ncbi:MAG: hypothetical protein JW769_04500 [Parachlamydiales bacterium]|nr:hypothetical protein [Parachlamydiales bacterium]
MPTKTDHCIAWFLKREKLVFYGLMAFLIFAVIVMKIVGYATKGSSSDFYQARKQLESFSGNENSWETAMKIWKKYPSLIPGYQARLLGKMMDLYHPCVKHAYAELNSRAFPGKLFENFSKVSYLIGQENYEESLRISKGIKKELVALKEPENFAAVYFFNLLRMSLLYQKTGQHAKELKTLSLVESLMAKQSYQKILVSFEKDLSRYVPQRKNDLMAQVKKASLR